MLRERDVARTYVVASAAFNALGNAERLEFGDIAHPGSNEEFLGQQSGRAGLDAVAAADTGHLVFVTAQFADGCSDDAIGGASDCQLVARERHAHHRSTHDQAMGAPARFVAALVPAAVASKLYVDTGPVVERVYAKYAGLGWFGKNTCLLQQHFGSWLLLGELILTIPLEYDQPGADHCGTCTRCLDACPTEALVAPYVLDARRCISYLTIELKGAIPEVLRPQLGQHVFGCDICQDVCPWNRKRHFTHEPDLQPRPQQVLPRLAELAVMTREDFKRTFRGTPLERTKRRGLLRNVCVAMGNSGQTAFIPMLETLAQDEEELVREHAAWAPARLRQAQELSASSLI